MTAISSGWMRALGLGAVSYLALAAGGAGIAQAQSNLPSVTVDAPRQQAAKRAPVRRTATRVRTAPRSVAAPAPAGPREFVESPTGPVRGYVAGRSSSATKGNARIVETPQSVSVVSADQLTDQKINAKFDEALRYTPGVFAGTFGADNRNDWFIIRGFKSDDNSLFLDSLQLFYTSYASWKLQPFNVERIEILRGPSAVLYGGSAPGGLVNAISKLPPAEPIRYIEAGVNNWGNAYTQFDFGGPVASTNGQLSYRVVGQVRGGDTQTKYVQDDNYFIAPSFTWRPDADTKFTLYGSASHSTTKAVNFLPYIGTVVDAPFGKIRTSLFAGDPNVDKFRREQQMVGYQFEKNLTDAFTVRQNARIAHVDVYYSGLFGLGYATTPAAANLARGNFLTTGVATQGNIDTQFEYRFDLGGVRHTTLVGVDLKRYGVDDFQGFGGATSLNVVNPVYTPFNSVFNGAPFQDARLTQNQVGVYVQDMMKWNNFTLVLSGRNDWVDLYNNNRLGADQRREDSKFSGRAGLIYNFANGVAPYASYATSYNPIIGTNFSTGQLQLPETGEQTEVGVKFEPVGWNMRLGMAVFELKRKNALTADPTNPLNSIQNGEVTSRGVELEALANITPNWKLVASYTKYDLFVSKDGTPALIGSVPTNTPRELASLWTDYTFRDGSWLNGFGFGGGVRYIGNSFADTANTLVVPSVVLGDLALHYDWSSMGGNWRAAVNFLNIADTAYVSSCSSPTACFYGDRRRVTGSIAYKW